MKIEPAANLTNCPKCGGESTTRDACSECGIVFHKYRNRSASGMNPPRPTRRQTASGFPYKTVTRLSQLLLLVSVLLLVLSSQYQERLPEREFYAGVKLADPVQTETSAAPFKIESNDIVYTINPVQDYQLQGIVVSYHDSDTWWDIYHHKSWQDFINTKDLCVIWGDNVSSGVYRQMEFENSTWTCWAYWPDRETGRRFSMHQLSNNHLLVTDPYLQGIVDDVEIGDQIRIQGQLASYSHSNGRFTRGTSTSRTDTGNGACETIYVNDFEIVKRANGGWHKVNTLAWWLIGISLANVLLLVVRAPVRFNG